MWDRQIKIIQKLRKEAVLWNWNYWGKEVRWMERKLMVTAVEIVSDLGVSRAYAYNLIKRLNAELEAKGYITISGKVSRKYYEEKIYGMQTEMKGA